MKIVIFEDDTIARQALESCLIARGFKVTAYGEPLICPLYRDPSCTCPESEPCGDILITDNIMPRMTGLEFIRQQHVRGCKGVTQFKALISGNLAPSDIEAARQLGCKVFSKPLVLGDLFAWLEQCRASLAPAPPA